MTLEGWIFMVGLRVFDVGALIVWMVWFFKLKDDGDDPSDDGDDFRRHGGDEPTEPQPPVGGPGLDLPKLDAEPWPTRRRDHGGDRAPATAPLRRTPQPVRREREPARR